ncbi:MAG: Uma2 family endonuclease [Alkalinema sp. RU_4_3]|nr:Uma2 family endonuclease [Alkalinema sp. RU_4_3]
MVQTLSGRSSLFVIPPLENGDRLSRIEFERRYVAMPEGTKAELIEGIVYMAAALRYRSHGKPHSQLNGWLFNYQVATPGVETADAITVRLDDQNEPQPDIALLISPEAGGQTVVSADDYIEGAPELVAEISASTVSIDLGAKKTAYQRSGVQEYIVWRVLDQAVDWFYLEDGQYCDLLPDNDGITRSRRFPGLWLDQSALLNGDLAQVLAVLQSGLASPEHRTFCESLES